jgi:hypothetical protein
MDFLELKIMNQDNHTDEKNGEFYENCAIYFEFLRKKGRTDYNFEDEYYFTMPAISNH